MILAQRGQLCGFAGSSSEYQSTSIIPSVVVSGTSHLEGPFWSEISHSASYVSDSTLPATLEVWDSASYTSAISTWDLVKDTLTSPLWNMLVTDRIQAPLQEISRAGHQKANGRFFLKKYCRLWPPWHKNINCVLSQNYGLKLILIRDGHECSSKGWFETRNFLKRMQEFERRKNQDLDRNMLAIILSLILATPLYLPHSDTFLF